MRLSPLAPALFASLLASLLSAAPSAAQDRYAMLPPANVPASSGGPARPILAWVDFCNRYERECVVDPSEPEMIKLTPAVWKLINEVNLAVNKEVSSVTDLEHWGVVDRWDFAVDGLGDCEDFQLLKRKRLRQAGLPQRAMLMTVVLDENNEGHAVLMIRTDRGDFVLDNKRNGVLPWQQTNYLFIKRESQMQTGWVTLHPAQSVTATAAK